MYLNIYLKHTNPVWLSVSYKFSHHNLKSAIIDLWKKHLKQVKNNPRSPHKNYLRQDVKHYLPIHKAASSLLGLTTGTDIIPLDKLLLSSHGPLSLLDCIFFEAGTRAEKIFIHDARLLNLYADIKQQELNQEIESITQEYKTKRKS